MNISLDFWLILGFAAQGLFAARFIIQWLVSEYKKQSVVPNAFWFLSLFGGLLLFIYAIHRKDPVFILGQGSGLLIYSRNLYLIYRKRSRLMLPDSSTQPKSNHLFVLLASLFIFFNLIQHTDKFPLTGEEDRRCIIAQEMLLSGDFIHPTVFNVPYYKKPPMHNWLIALFNLGDGQVDRVSARLVSILSLLTIGWSLYLFLLKTHPDKALAGFLAVTTNYLMMCEYGNLAETDIILTLFTLLSFLLYLLNPRNLAYIFISSLFMGAGFLTKGLSPLYFYPAVLLTAFLQKDRRFRQVLLILLHFMLSLILPAIWLWLYAENGNLTELVRIFSSEVSEKSVGSVGTFFWHLIYFPLKIFLVLMPWSMVVLFFIKKRIKKDEIYWTSLFMFAISLLIFTLSPESRDRYLMPAFPAFAILCAYHIDPESFPNILLRKSILIILAVASLGISIFGFMQDYLIQAAIFLLMAVWWLFMSKRNLSTLKFGAVLAAFMLVAYMQGLFFYRAQIRFDHEPGVQAIAEKITEPLPIVARPWVSNRTGLFLEAELQRPVYKLPRSNFQSYYYLTYPSKVDSTAEILLTVPYPEDSSRDLILQLIKNTDKKAN